jgi:hypothetical protein
LGYFLGAGTRPLSRGFSASINPGTVQIDKTGTVTLRIAGRLRHIGVGRTHARTRVILLVQDLHVTVTHAATGEILRDLIIDPRKDYQPRGPKKK